MEDARVTHIVAALAGTLSFLSPCVLPLFPSYLSAITGLSVSEMTAVTGRPAARRRVVPYALGFVLGFSVIFVALGASLSVLGQLLLGNLGIARRVSGLFIIALGLVVAGVVRVPWLMRGWDAGARARHAGVAGAFLLGAAFAVSWTPCIGPVLGAILFLAGTADQAARGMTLLGAYSLGLGLPFLASALALDRFLSLFQRFRPLLPWVDRVAGLLLVVMGALVFTGYMTRLNAYFISLTPSWLLEYL